MMLLEIVPNALDNSQKNVLQSSLFVTPTALLKSNLATGIFLEIPRNFR